MTQEKPETQVLPENKHVAPQAVTAHFLAIHKVVVLPFLLPE
jgi:hypothetical protein